MASAYRSSVGVDWNERGTQEIDRKNFDLAIEYFDKAIAANPKLAEAYCNRSHARCEKGDYKGAIKDATRAIELNPRRNVLSIAYSNRATAHLDLGDLDAALRDCKRALVKNPTSP